MAFPFLLDCLDFSQCTGLGGGRQAGSRAGLISVGPNINIPACLSFKKTGRIPFQSGRSKLTSSTGVSPVPKFSRADELLRAREAHVLTWSLAARNVAFAIVVIFSLLHLLGIVRGIVSETDADAVIVLVISLGCIAVVSYGLILARRGEHLRRVGLGAVSWTWPSWLPYLLSGSILNPTSRWGF